MAENKAIDRNKTCPFLLRIFVKSTEHHNDSEFKSPSSYPDSEVQIHTWMDATFRELTDLLRAEHIGIVSNSDKRNIFSFAFVFPSKVGVNVVRQVGETNLWLSVPEDGRTLQEAQFEIGDFISLAFK